MKTWLLLQILFWKFFSINTKLKSNLKKNQNKDPKMDLMGPSGTNEPKWTKLDHMDQKYTKWTEVD